MSVCTFMLFGIFFHLWILFSVLQHLFENESVITFQYQLKFSFNRTVFFSLIMFFC